MKSVQRTLRASATAVSLATVLFAAPICSAASPTWQQKVDSIIGWKGQTMPDNVLRFTLVPKLTVQVGGNTTFPNLVLDGYAAFHAEGSQVLMTAEIATAEAQADDVANAATAAGLTVTALHNHLVKDSPRILYVHMSGCGDPVALARGVKAALAATHVGVYTDDDQDDADDVAPGLNQSTLDSIMKSTGKPVDGVLEYSFERPENFTLGGHALPPSMGPESEVHFQSLGHGQAAEAAEIALLETEVPKALRVLQAEGLTVRITALHNHFITESPRLFFVHTWGTGDAGTLARAIRKVLDQTPQ